MKDRKLYNILVIEDNAGDYELIQGALQEVMDAPVLTAIDCFCTAQVLLQPGSKNFDVILLDLTLPDMQGESLIHEIVELALNTPVIVLTGYTDISFGVKSLSLGISDYILKDELTANALYKSIIYSMERKKGTIALEASEKRYADLFQLSPLPMWVVDIDTLKFLDVNAATINYYGYSREEFMAMKLKDIRPVEELPGLEEGLAEVRSAAGKLTKNIMVHKLKNGDLRDIEVKISPMNLNNARINVVVATDITDRLNHIKAIEEQNKKLKEIAWIQSHVVRAPLARMMSLIDIVNNFDVNEEDRKKYLGHIITSANELDGIIKNISDKTRATSV